MNDIMNFWRQFILYILGQTDNFQENYLCLGDFSWATNDETDTAQEGLTDCIFYNNRTVSRISRSFDNQLVTIKLTKHFNVTENVGAIRLCTNNDQLNDSTVLRSVGMGQWEKGKSTGSGTYLRVCPSTFSCKSFSMLIRSFPLSNPLSGL